MLTQNKRYDGNDSRSQTQKRQWSFSSGGSFHPQPSTHQVFVVVVLQVARGLGVLHEPLHRVPLQELPVGLHHAPVELAVHHPRRGGLEEVHLVAATIQAKEERGRHRVGGQ